MKDLQDDGSAIPNNDNAIGLISQAPGWNPDDQLDNFIVDDLGEGGDLTQIKSNNNMIEEEKGISNDVTMQNTKPLSTNIIKQTNIISNKLHLPFQSGYTKQDENKRQYLYWNEIGCILCHCLDSEYSYEVDFSDTTKYTNIRFRLPELMKYASIGESGVLFCGSKKTDEKNKRGGSIHFRAFNAVSTKVWTLTLPINESAVSCCVCGNYLAVGTNKLFLRLYNTCGSQIAIFSLPGPIVTLTCNNEKFAVVFNQGNGLSTRIYNTTTKNIEVETNLCLSYKSKLIWCQLTNSNVFITLDSNNIYRGLFNNWSWNWIPILNTQDIFKIKPTIKDKMDIDEDEEDVNSTEYIFWPVFVDTELMQIFGAKIDKIIKYPDVAVRPKLEPIAMSLPLCMIPRDNKECDIQKTTDEYLRSDLFHPVTDKASGLKADKLKMVLFQKYAEKGLLDNALNIVNKIININVLKKTIKIAQYFEQNKLVKQVKNIIQIKEAEKKMELLKKQQELQRQQQQTTQHRQQSNVVEKKESPKNKVVENKKVAPKFGGGKLKNIFTPNDPFSNDSNNQNNETNNNNDSKSLKRKNPFGSTKPTNKRKGNRDLFQLK